MNRRFATALLVLGLAATGSEPVHGQASHTRSVMIAVIENYPAFQPPSRQPDPRAKEMRAVVIRRDPTTSAPDTSSFPSVILLNPDHLNPRTLADAVEVLGACPRAGADSPLPNFAPVGLAQSRRTGAGDTSRWAAHLAELRTQPTVELPKLGGSGRAITVDVDLPACAGASAAP